MQFFLIVILYLDQKILLSQKYVYQQVDRLEKVLIHLIENGVTISGLKSGFGFEKINLLGYEISDKGRSPTDSAIQAIQELSPAYRTVFNLYVIENYSHKEISELLGISEGTSKSNLSKAKFNLQKIISQHLSSIENE